VRPGRPHCRRRRRIIITVPGTMDVICTRKQKPGEISPARVYISPENDNTPRGPLCYYYPLCVFIYIYIYVIRRPQTFGPLADDPPHRRVSPGTRHLGALNAVDENVLTVYGICIARRGQNVYRILY
jgi:hypothetical protein